MIDFADAQRLVIEHCAPLATETIRLEAAVGRICARTIRAIDDLVPFARSAMDGYAVCAADVAALPVTLPLSAAVFAAVSATQPSHARGSATAIATGAALPDGADAVVPYEDAEIVPGGIRFTQSVAAGDAIFPPGEDARAGDVLVSGGTPIAPSTLGILAAAGYAEVAVHRRPIVTIVCSGDELVAIDAQPRKGQIRNSNAVMLAASLTLAGADVRDVVSVADDRARVRDAVAHALAQSDLVVTTGGASVGERDYVKAVCAELGVRFAFDTVALRPAKPTAFGRLGTAAIAVLPGNPAAAFVALHEFVLPAIRALQGRRETLPVRLTVKLDGELHAKPQRHFAAFAALRATPSGLVAVPLGNQCSSLTRTVAECCGLIVVPPGTANLGSGDDVAFDVVDWSKLQALESPKAPSPVRALS